MEKTRILFVLPQLDAGGSERVVFDLARSLDSRRFEVYAAAFKAGALLKPLNAICRQICLIDKKPGFDLAAMLKVAKFIKENGIDVVNAHHYMPFFYSFLGTKVLNGRRLFYTEHSLPEVEALIQSVHGRLLDLMLFRLDGVVGVSRAVAERFRGRYGRHRHNIHEILNGVDLDKYQARAASRKAVRSGWRLQDDHFVVGTVANFRKVKNHLCLVRAAARLKESHPRLRLMFVGTGFPGDAENSEDEVRAAIRRLGLEERVILAGYQEDIPEMLSAFDAFCLPSFSEGLPVSVLEAMAAGLPVIGSRTSGIVEVVQEEKTGYLFPVDDDSSLSAVLAKICEDPGSAGPLAEKALDYVTRFHGLQGWSESYARLFRGADAAAREGAGKLTNSCMGER